MNQGNRKRLPPRAIGDAVVAVLKKMQEQGFSGNQVTWGDCYVLDEIADQSGFLALHPHVHPLNRHQRVLNALDRELRLWKFLFRCCDSNGKREVLGRAFRLLET